MLSPHEVYCCHMEKSSTQNVEKERHVMTATQDLSGFSFQFICFLFIHLHLRGHVIITSSNVYLPLFIISLNLKSFTPMIQCDQPLHNHNPPITSSSSESSSSGEMNIRYSIAQMVDGTHSILELCATKFQSGSEQSETIMGESMLPTTTEYTQFSSLH